MRRNGISSLAIIVIIAVLLAVGGGVYFIMSSGPERPPAVACTMEAMRCPDGSYVGRVGPKCEFAPCPEAPAASGARFGAAVTLTVGQTVTFDDGLTVELLRIDDSRCPSGVQCIWQGELSATLKVSGGAYGSAGQITLGTVRGDETTAAGYRFTLKDATPKTIVLLIVRVAE